MTPEESINWRRDIGGWSKDILPFYDQMAQELPDCSRIVEVGVYHGRSLCYLAQRLHELGKPNCVLVGVDSYRWHPDDLQETRKNLDSVPGGDKVALVVAPSLVAARLFESFRWDLVFIDGFHEYDTVLSDVIAWRPVVRNGGMLAGHDYGETMHPGVKQAVDEVFPDGVNVWDTVWSARL